ncbi:LPS-assembly protein LptD [Orrella marina]|uniref:LPS-assembly protein LptD n=2 Tax=Orrella marina TaxID=2163011 RepID=A0A2R4XQ21_9BURK|nr:LPS-assembly protein LptD [Orrella marina]
MVTTAALGAAGESVLAQPAQAAPSAKQYQPVEARIVSGLRESSGLRPVGVDPDTLPVYLEAMRMTSDGQDFATLEGAASARRADAVIKARRLHFDQASNVMTGTGNARLVQDGNIVVGPSLRFNMENNSGQVEQPNFWLQNAGSGVGSKADIKSKDEMTVTDVTYTGCPCPDPAWRIEASKVDLHFDENEGIARNGVLYFKDVPILASPYLTFPIRKERKSGFLAPTFAITSQTGFDMALPYYFNIAPNYDATLTLRPTSKRGLQLGGEFRYLQPDYFGTMAGTYLNNDYQLDRSRWAYSWQHNQVFGNGFYGNFDLNGVSDKDYFRDFTTLAINQASTSYLPKTGNLGWSNKYWQANVQVASYQTIADVVPQYNKLPEFTLTGTRFDWNGFDIRSQNAATWFRRPLSDQGLRLGPDGQRFTSYTSVAYPIVRPGWYITPKFGMHLTQYETDWYGLSMGGQQPANATRALPIMSIDSGMTFERQTSFFGSAAIQTLEPRIYYLRVPYRDQSNLPIYDTSLSDFSFSQAFQENIYNGGWDRIANANQLTVALGTRWLDEETGFERLAISAGQRFYFADQRVTLPGEAPRTDVRSDWLFGATAALTNTLSTSMSLQYNPYDNQWDRAQVTARWVPKRATSLSASYRYQRQPTGLYQPQGQDQISLSFQWPLTNNLYSVGRVDYSLLSDPSRNATPRVTQAIAGLEYKADCCWAARVVYQRYAIDPTSVNNAIFFQLELSGLGSLGQDPMGMLTRSIPSYENIAPNIPPVGKFERYE